MPNFDDIASNERACHKNWPVLASIRTVRTRPWSLRIRISWMTRSPHDERSAPRRGPDSGSARSQWLVGRRHPHRAASRTTRQPVVAVRTYRGDLRPHRGRCEQADAEHPSRSDAACGSACRVRQARCADGERLHYPRAPHSFYCRLVSRRRRRRARSRLALVRGRGDGRWAAREEQRTRRVGELDLFGRELLVDREIDVLLDIHVEVVVRR